MRRIALVALVTLLTLPGAARAGCKERLPFIGIAREVDLVAVLRIERVDGNRLHAVVERVLAGASGLRDSRVVVTGAERAHDYPPDGPTPGSRWAVALDYQPERQEALWAPPSYCATAVLRVEGDDAIGEIDDCGGVSAARTEMGLTATTEGQRMSIGALQERIRSSTERVRCAWDPPSRVPYPGVPPSRPVSGVVLAADGARAPAWSASSPPSVRRGARWFAPMQRGASGSRTYRPIPSRSHVDVGGSGW